MAVTDGAAARPIARHARRRFLARHVDVTGLAVLEVGAFDSPTFRGPKAPTVRYLDRFGRDELAERHRHHPNRAAAVDVDYVVTEKRFADSISDRFDLIVANHVIEHVADPITWLEQLALITRPAGHLLLSVPDRRFTFDYLRKEATVVDWLRARHDDLERPSMWQIMDSRYYYRPLKRDDFLGGAPPTEKLARRRKDLATALAEAEAASTADSYAGVHCFAYTSSSFAALVTEVQDAGLIPWRLADIDDACAELGEFHALFSK
jgi:SAM-dependent methyltransferase